MLCFSFLDSSRYIQHNLPRWDLLLEVLAEELYWGFYWELLGPGLFSFVKTGQKRADAPHVAFQVMYSLHLIDGVLN